ncbi:LysR family transcriptional regulator [Streptomyces sp. NPDC091215]|uniref:LysR family transcriptional regulator n=1 Tax=Streptomyces sp. NPDC091215 TaxID=3155192 RepID=UPI00343A4614
MDLRSLDLNLLLSLDALLQQCSVSKAARQMGVGQPAMSSSLARLRRHFGDELLARTGNRYLLTPLAMELQGQVRTAVSGVERVFAAGGGFDPRTTTREFSLIATDYAEAVLATAVADLLSRRAPHSRLRLAQPQLTAHPARALNTGDTRMLGIDLVIMPHAFVTDLHHQDLYQDEWVCLVSADNKTVGPELTTDDLRRLPWVVTFHSAAGTTQGMAGLQGQGVDPRVQMVTEHFLGLPGHVAGSDRIALLQRRLTDLLPPRPDLRILPCPVDAGSLNVAMWWHPVHDDDPVHTWFRELVRDAARTLKPLST